MKRYLFAVAVAVLAVGVVGAEDKPATPAPTTSAPVMMGTTGTMYVEYVPVQSTRRGLFARLRNRSNRVTYTTMPMVTMPTSPAPMPTPAPQPMPMPGTKSDNTVSMPKTTTVVPATGNLPPGIYTTTDGTVVQIGGTTSGGVMTATYTESTPVRRGFFGRLRNR
ncbi:MAG: hypothetical protein RMJ56_15730 [Gemmataceae bacterium]|nr:hypothetical protein [Gemmata sp.]MDW8199047.1 hypothetical protein [Gemmataceae bacterium]